MSNSKKVTSKRPKSTTAKMGFTKSSKRRYSCGGKIKK